VKTNDLTLTPPPSIPLLTPPRGLAESNLGVTGVSYMVKVGGPAVGHGREDLLVVDGRLVSRGVLAWVGGQMDQMSMGFRSLSTSYAIQSFLDNPADASLKNQVGADDGVGADRGRWGRYSKAFALWRVSADDRGASGSDA
jgi:hypothetical protein